MALKKETEAVAASPQAEEVARLARLARDGDRRAFELLMESHSDRIHRMVFARVRSSMDAQDITQEVFIKAFEKLHRLREPEKFTSWLYTIARNKVRDHHRKKKILFLFSEKEEDGPREVPDREAGENPEALDRVLKKEFWGQVDRFSKTLSKKEREVFYLRFLDGLSIPEIADVMGRNTSTVKTHLYRALEKFQSQTALRALVRREAL